MNRSETRFAFDPAIPPVATVTSGATLVIETQDAHSGTITGPEVVYRDLADVMERIGGANPVTGPIAIEGVSAGDVIEIDVLDVDGAPETGFGYMNTTPSLHPDLVAETVLCHRVEGGVEMPTHRGPIRLPYRPFVGTLGVAPAGPGIESFRQGADILGNVDLPDLGPGATVVLRANVDGALVSMGDAHLLQGDAEIHRSAIETHADVTVTLRRSRADAGFVGLPQINTSTELGSVAPGPGHLEDLVRLAYDDLAARLTAHGFHLAEAYRLLGAVGTVRIGQVVPPVFSAMAKIHRSHIEGTPPP